MCSDHGLIFDYGRKEDALCHLDYFKKVIIQIDQSEGCDNRDGLCYLFMTMKYYISNNCAHQIRCVLFSRLNVGFNDNIIKTYSTSEDDWSRWMYDFDFGHWPADIPDYKLARCSIDEFDDVIGYCKKYLIQSIILWECDVWTIDETVKKLKQLDELWPNWKEEEFQVIIMRQVNDQKYPIIIHEEIDGYGGYGNNLNKILKCISSNNMRVERPLSISFVSLFRVFYHLLSSHFTFVTKQNQY